MTKRDISIEYILEPQKPIFDGGRGPSLKKEYIIMFWPSNLSKLLQNEVLKTTLKTKTSSTNVCKCFEKPH